MCLYHHSKIIGSEHTADKRAHRRLGFSLIELLLSLSLSLLIIGAAFEWYQILKKVNRDAKEKRQTLEIGRTALQFLMNDVKQSGYYGCRTMDENFAVQIHLNQYISPYRFFKKEAAVSGFVATQGKCVRQLPASACDRIKEMSDVLVIYNIPQKISALKKDMGQPTEVIQTVFPTAIRRGSVVLIADCLQGDLFVANEVEGDRIYHGKTAETNLRSDFSKAYQRHAEIIELASVAYYLGVPTRSRKDSVSYSLFRDDLWHEAEEMMEGVVDFQVEYGVFRVSQGSRYLRAEFIRESEWQFVQSIRLVLLTENKEHWEYEFAVRNRRRVNSDVNRHDGGFSFNRSRDDTRDIDS